MFVKFVGHVLPTIGVSGGDFFARNVRPFAGIFGVEGKPFLQARRGVGLDRFGWAFGLADAAIDALVGIDDEHVLAFIEAVHGAHFDAVHVFAFDTGFGDDKGHFAPWTIASPVEGTTGR